MAGERGRLQSPRMNLKRIVPVVLLVGFSALTAEVVIRDGYTEWLRIAFENRSAGLLLVDLTIACSLAIGWMTRDARARGTKVWPFALLTVLFGSVGPLAYLVLRGAGAGASASDRRADHAEERAPGGLRLERNEPLA
jgi:hypothetical protein